MTEEMVLLYEADGTNPNGFILCLMGDGHIEPMKATDAIKAIVKTLKAGPPTTTRTPAER